MRRAFHETANAHGWQLDKATLLDMDFIETGKAKAFDDLGALSMGGFVLFFVIHSLQGSKFRQYHAFVPFCRSFQERPFVGSLLSGYMVYLSRG